MTTRQFILTVLEDGEPHPTSDFYGCGCATSTIYHVLKKLVNKGIVATVKMGNKRYWMLKSE